MNRPLPYEPARDAVRPDREGDAGAHGRGVTVGASGAARSLSARTPVADDARVRVLVADLARRGVELRIEDGRLRWRARPGEMDVPTLRLVKSSEPELIALVRGDGER